ncbi:MAG: prephenate dehydratase [Elusimicrobiota bacterium]|nr:prephenate dehydratase [Elusimicrobiota bacterium]
MDLKNLREKIDAVDNQILKLLNQRTRAVQEIAKLKAKAKQEFYAPHREKKILERLLKKNKGPLPNEALRGILQEILNVSRSIQKKLRVAYLGPPATFTHLAAVKNFGKFADFTSAKSIADVFSEVEKGRSDYGVVPIENSTEGVINHTLDMFVASELKICSELLLEISHNLLSRARELGEIKRIYSHPQAIAQSRNWIEDSLPNAELVETSSTAKAAELAEKDSEGGAIASRLAASLYDLKIIAEGIEDSVQNYTRFLVIGKNYPGKSGQDKTSILFSVKDRVGALHDMLIPFRENKINLTKIESRPTKLRAWEYIFFVDFAGHVEEENVKRALQQLEKECLFLKILGSYPRSE